MARSFPRRRATKTPASSKDQIGLRKGFRSGLEGKVAAQFAERGLDPRYESVKIKYTRPASEHSYTPDFPLWWDAEKKEGCFIETKGYFEPEDRKKHLWIKAQHPKIEVRFVFSRSAAPIRKGSQTTLADWCNQHGFKYADKIIPQAWFDEAKHLASRH
jgi:hypothetical protein